MFRIASSPQALYSKKSKNLRAKNPDGSFSYSDKAAGGNT